MMMVPIDPGGSSHSHPLMAPHPLSLRASVDTVVTPEQILSYGPPRGRADICPSRPSLQSMPPGAHQFHGPQGGWLEVHPRGGGTPQGIGGAGGSGRPGQHSAAATGHPQPTGIPQTGGPPRRSPRAGGPVFRFDFPPQHHHMHPPPPPQQRQHHPSSSGGGGGGAGPPSASDQFVAPQQRRVPSPRSNGGCGGGALVVGPSSLQQQQQQQQQQQRSQTMRSGVPGAAAGGLVCGPRRRPEHLHLVGPLGDPMFVGSPTVVAHSGGCGGGGGGGEGNTGPETVSRVLIPNCKIGAVIGKGGAIIKHIREVSGAKVTISDSCTGLHDDADDRMVTAAGTFNSVQLAFTHILSHAGAVGPDADPVMGLAGGDPDCVANSFRLLIPNVKAGGLIGRGGCTIKAIREHSGARIEISSHAFHFHPIHGPLPAPSMSPPPPPPHGGGTGLGPSSHGPVTSGGPGPGPRVVGPVGNGFGPGGAGGGPNGNHSGSKGPDHRIIDRNNIILPPAILMDRVLTAMGSFDACLRAHHLVASKLMDVRPSPVPMPTGPPATSAQAAAAAAALAAHARGGVNSGPTGHRSCPRPIHGPPRVFNFDSARGAGGVGIGAGVGGNSLRFQGAAAAASGGGGGGGGLFGTTPTASTSPASSVSELSSSCHRQLWGSDERFEDPSWAASSPASPPLPELRRCVSGVSRGSGMSRSGSGSGRLSASSSPDLASSSASGSPGSGSLGSAEGLVGSAAADAPAIITQLSLGTSAASSTGGGGAVPSIIEATRTPNGATGSSGSGSGSGSGGDGGGAHGVLEGSSYIDNEELPACLADILDSFFGGSSSGVAAPRSPSTITGIDVEVGRAAFALLGVRDLDDIKHLSGAGIVAPESPESYCHLSGEVVAAAAAAVLSGPHGTNNNNNSVNGAAAVAAGRAAARGTAPADGLGLAAAESNAVASAAAAAAAATTTTTSGDSFPSPGSSPSVVTFNSLGSRIELALTEGFGKEDSVAANAAVQMMTAGSTVANRSSSRSSSSPSSFSPPMRTAGRDGGGAGCGVFGMLGSANPRSFRHDTTSMAPTENKATRSEFGFAAGTGAASVKPVGMGTGNGSPPFTPLPGYGVGMGVGGGGGGDDDYGGSSDAHNALKTVRITGTAEEVQLAEYLIRVRTAGRYMVAA